MNIPINIRKEDILSEVNRLTAFTARQVDGAFDRITATSDEERVVLSYYHASISDLAGKLSGFKPIISEGSIDLDLPSTFDVLLCDSVEKAIIGYIVNEICDRWFSVTKPDENGYKARSGLLLMDIESLLNVRIKPRER